jgi:transcriptional regulator with XRE-family HTH domain
MLGEQRMTKNELAERSKVSPSFLSDLTTGSGNPSLKTMEAIASALGTPLPMLLEATDMPEDVLEQLKDGKFSKALPPNFEWVAAALPSHQAFIVRRWAKEAKTKIADE